ncbi:MAG: HAMP domain-containing protein [Planctomycetes bacterium]|uniref:sensor histidine kinase n=1 Tax=Candidatus Wunengus californicus TaxID=3367619 RepID=UPI004028FA8A|nr:HAMP domain-containing protein [Planctomycetota bacterium]
MGILIIIVGILICLFFLIHSKRQQEETLRKLGTSLVTLLAQDNEVKHALNYTQSAFLDAPIKKVQALDMEEEIGYWRISNSKTVMVEENASWLNIQMKEIPTRHGDQSSDVQLTHRMITASGETFYDFSIPVVEKQTFSEEAFAAQLLGEIPAKAEQKILGFVQIGLSPHKLNERIHKIILRSIIPMGVCIVCGGICITFFFTKYFVSPIRHMACITLDIAKGNLTRTVDIHSRDEIGQLSLSFNQMTKALKASYDEKEKIMAQLRENVNNLFNANKELVKINEQLNEAQERLIRSEKLAVVGKLASGVGHELRNPLGAIRNALFIIKKKSGNTCISNDVQKFNKLVEIVEKETDRSIKIVNDLLGFSRTAKSTVSPTNICSLIESSLSRLKIPDKINKVVQVEDTLPLVAVDANQIEQVLINLIQNALDAMPKGGWLTIHARREDNFLAVTITDTGCGIPDTIKNKIFDPLFTTKPKGMGLGLAISSNIIQRHEGSIDLKSKEGDGASFTVKLPITKT